MIPHHGSHRHLLTPVEGSAPASVDAIIVPTVRPVAYLHDAVAAAAHLGCPLVTLSSGYWTSAARVTRGLGDFGVELVAIDLPQRKPLSIPFQGPEFLRSTSFARRADTAAKRNIGTLLARLAGWERVVFLDDDIVVPDPHDLARAAGALGSFERAALQVTGFPALSVVGHAHRGSGGRQEPFAGAGAMAVATARAPAHFPTIYHEDWFDLLSDEDGLRPTAVTGTASQWPYDPYHRPERAASEEFGDVLAEGLFWLLDNGQPWTDHTEGHWREMLKRRLRFIEDVLTRRRDAPARASLLAAHRQLRLITPKACTRFVKGWAQARSGWREHLTTLPTGLKTAEACEELAVRHPELTVGHRERRPAVRALDRAPVTKLTPWTVRNPRPGGGFLRVGVLSESDLPRVVKSLGQRPYFTRALARQRSGHGLLLIAWDHDLAVGTLYIWLGKAEERRLRRWLRGTPLLTHLDLLPAYRETGFGTLLLHTAEEVLTGLGHTRVALGVGLNNPHAQRLYVRLGYRKWKRSPVPTTEEILHEDGSSERKPDKCHILYKPLSAFPASLR